MLLLCRPLFLLFRLWCVRIPFLLFLLEWFLSHCCTFLFVPFLFKVLLLLLLAIFLVCFLLCRWCPLFLGKSFLFPCLPLWRFRLGFCLVLGFYFFLAFIWCIPFLFLIFVTCCFLFCIPFWVSSRSLLYVLFIPHIQVFLVWPGIGLRSSLLCAIWFPVGLLFLVHLLLLYCILFHFWFSFPCLPYHVWVFFCSLNDIFYSLICSLLFLFLYCVPVVFWLLMLLSSVMFFCS